MRTKESDLAAWEAHRPLLLGLAYRMLGDVARAEDMVQETWLRWSGRADDANEPRAYLAATVTRLCLNELSSARVRLENRSDRLPEPVALQHGGLDAVELGERISMAFLVVLQRLSASERAVLLLHDVFDFQHAEIAALVGKSAPTCRKLLERARTNVAAEKRLLETSHAEHVRILHAFLGATSQGDVAALVALLAVDAVLVTDGGPGGRRVAGVQNLDAPLAGAERIAAFVTNVTGKTAGLLTREIRELNGQPALVLLRDGAPFGVMLLGVADGRVHRVFFHGDPARLGHLG